MHDLRGVIDGGWACEDGKGSKKERGDGCDFHDDGRGARLVRYDDEGMLEC